MPTDRIRHAALLCCFLLLRVAAAQQLAGISVTPHIQSSNMRWRRPPDPELGARVELFIKNDTDSTMSLDRQAPVRFDGSTPDQLIDEGHWAWHDTPACWLEDSTDVPPGAMTVLAFNSKRRDWGVATKHELSMGNPTVHSPIEFQLDQPTAWLSAVTFLGEDSSVHPTRLVLYIANRAKHSLQIKSCRLWLPPDSSSHHVYQVQSDFVGVETLSADGIVAAGEKGGVMVQCEPLPLTYGVVEVAVASPGGAEQSLWAHLRIKKEVFDISGGWVSSAIDGRNSLSFEPYLKTLKRMHINTGHIEEVLGYTDNPVRYRQYPLKRFARLRPLERYDVDAMLPEIHAVEFLGEPQYGGGRPVPPQEVWRELAPYQATRLPTTVTHSEERIWRYYAGLSDYPHFDAYRVTAPAADSWSAYDRWGGERIRWGAPLETIGDLTRSLRELNRPKPIAYWSQGAHDGWGLRGGRRGSPTPDELRSQAYHALAQRITSLYWFNLSLPSLVKFPDLIEPITRVNREIRLIDEVLLEGDAYEYQRLFEDGRPVWDLSSVVSPRAGLFFVNDLQYAPHPELREFRFESDRLGRFTFKLPRWLSSPAAVFRIDADGFHKIAWEIHNGSLTIEDRVNVAGMYISAVDNDLQNDLAAEFDGIKEAEQGVGFDPGNKPDDLKTLKVCSTGYEDRSFADLMREFKPTWYSAVPTIHQSVIAMAKENPAVAASGCLRLIRSSSSSLPPTVMAELEETFRVPVIESYGMTEAAHQMASNPLPPAVRKPGSVGLPAGPEMAIMDEQGNLLPAAETGEIVIRGSNVTAGYANNPAANEAAFTNGWFRTGDLGCTDEDGYFSITGRKKEMINRGGENISPREIDEALLGHPSVAQAVAFAVPHPSLGEDVAAAVVLQDGADVSEQELRDFAFTRLAEFKVPSQIIFVDVIPKGPTGKLQRIGLHERLAPLLQAEYVAPEGPFESKLGVH